MNATATVRRPETWVFALVLLAANFTLLTGNICEPLIYSPAKATGGEWWRLLTFPLVHVGWYHFLLDAGAFLFLYHGLLQVSFRKRMLYVAGCAVGTLLVSLSAETLCGLSGIAHGLMAISGLEMMTREDRASKNTGVICFSIVVIKSIYEALSGQVAFSFLHFGTIGNAVAICHAGGVAGGILVYALLRRRVRPKETIDAAHPDS